MSRPHVSVLLPVRNGGPFLIGAVQSILRQTFRDLELLVIDDHSVDGSVDSLAEVSDSRMHLIKNFGSPGFSSALNLGLAEASGRYVARMDGDDVSLPGRLEKQFLHLERCQEIDILGTHVNLLDPTGVLVKDVTLRPQSPGHVHWSLLFYCSLAHPTVMMRRSIFSTLVGYNQEFSPAEDYELWLRAMDAGFTIANLSEPLLNYRVNPEGMSHAPGSTQQRVALGLSAKALQGYVGSNLTVEEEYLQALRDPQLLRCDKDLRRLLDWSAHLIKFTIDEAVTRGMSPIESGAVRRHGSLLLQRLRWYAAKQCPREFFDPRRRSVVREAVSVGRYLVQQSMNRLRSRARTELES